MVEADACAGALSGECEEGGKVWGCDVLVEWMVADWLAAALFGEAVSFGPWCARKSAAL